MRMRKRCGVLCATAGLVALHAGAADATAAKRVTFREVATGNNDRAGYGTVARLLRTERTARMQLTSWTMDDALPELATVDFERRAIIVVLDDRRGGGGARVHVDGVSLSGRTVSVVVTVSPRRGPAVSGRGWAVVSVPRAAVGAAWPDVRVDLRCEFTSHCG